MTEYLGQWTQQWGPEGVLEILRPAFEPVLRIIKQFVHISNEYTYLPAYLPACLLTYLPTYLHTYMFVVILRIERRQDFFLC